MNETIESELENLTSKVHEKQGHCWFGIHKFSTWSYPILQPAEGLIGTITGMSLNKQSRYCLKCKRFDFRYCDVSH